MSSGEKGAIRQEILLDVCVVIDEARTQAIQEVLDMAGAEAGVSFSLGCKSQRPHYRVNGRRVADLAKLLWPRVLCVQAAADRRASASIFMNSRM